MRIAGVEWSPRINGATDYLEHLAPGFRKLGHEYELVAFGKTGKALKYWSRGERFRIERCDEAADVLDEYDFLVLSDVACFAPHLVREFTPYYVKALRATKTPFAALHHGNHYPKELDAHIGDVLRAPTFTKHVHTPKLPEAQAHLGRFKEDLRYTWTPHHPYDPARGASLVPHTPVSLRKRAMMMTARVAYGKGQDVASELLRDLRGDVHIWGQSPFARPTYGWAMWEIGTQRLGYVNGDPDETPEQIERRKWQIDQRWRGKWSMVSPATGSRFWYHDSYEKLEDVDWSPRLHVSLASKAYGHILEYATLDASFCGCLIAVPEHSLKYGSHETVVSLPFEGGKCRLDGERYTCTFDGDRQECVDRINAVFEMSDDDFAEALAAQREEVSRLHTTSEAAEMILGQALR